MTNVVSAVLVERGVPVRELRITVVKESRFRPVAIYAVRYTPGVPPSGTRTGGVVVKGYYRGGGGDTFDIMRHLWSDGFRGTATLTIAEPLAYVPEHDLMIQGVASGCSLHEHLLRPGTAIGTVRSTARWLAKLHRSDVQGSAVWGRDEEVAKTALYAETLSRVAPQAGSRFWDLTRGALCRMQSGPGRLVPTHGDFQPKNIYVSGRRITVIDFDRFAMADPARDVGHFVGQSLTMSYSRMGTFAEIRPWVDAFTAEYAKRAGSDALEMLPAFVARTFLEVLYYKLFVRPVNDPSFLPVWLDEAERWLTWSGP